MTISLLLIICVAGLLISVYRLSHQVTLLQQPAATQESIGSNVFPVQPNFHQHDDIEREMRRMQEQMHQMMQQSFSAPLFTTPDPLSVRHADDLQLQDAGDHYVITFKLPFPNISKNAINVTSADQSLTISGQAETTTSNKRQGVSSQQQSSRHFSRTISLPQPVDVSAMTTELKDGVLTINLPKQALPLQ